MNTEEEIQRRYELQVEFLGSNKPVNQTYPLVSVRTTTYQHGEFIEKCMEGILNQKTNFPFELVIGEDGSTDGTAEVCKKYAREYPHLIRLFERDRNLTQLYDENGKLLRRLNGDFTTRACRGKYIALCEGDDFWTDPLKLQKQVDFLEKNPEYQFSFHYSSIQKGDAIVGVRPQSGEGRITMSNLLFRKSYPTMSLVYRNDSSLLEDRKKIRNHFITGDFPLVLLLASKGPGYLFPDVMGVYRVHGGGVYSTLSAIKKLQIGIHNRRSALRHIPMNFKQRMICRLMIVLRQIKIWGLKIGLFR